MLKQMLLLALLLQLLLLVLLLLALLLQLLLLVLLLLLQPTGAGAAHGPVGPWGRGRPSPPFALPFSWMEPELRKQKDI